MTMAGESLDPDVGVARLPSQRDLQQVFTSPRWFRGSVRDWMDVWRSRELLGNLVRKELKVKYKDSFLGFFWTLVRPLLQLLVYSVAIGVFLGSGKVIPQFGVYLFTGLVAWTLFTDILGGATGSIVSNGGLVKKVNVPHELFPLSVVGASGVNFLLQLVVLIGAYVITRSWPDLGNLALVPLALVVLILFASALGFVLAAANVFLRDVQYLVEIGTLLWFWMTPIVYDWTKVRRTLSGSRSWMFDLYMANPMANVVLAFQRALWPGGRTKAGSAFYYDGNLVPRLLVIGAVSLVLLWFGQRVFARAKGTFAQEL